MMKIFFGTRIAEGVQSITDQHGYKKLTKKSVYIRAHPRPNW